MDHYHNNVDLPFSKKNINFRELKTKEQISLAKCVLNITDNSNNLYQVNTTIKNVIKHCIETPIILEEINIIDYILFITKIRIISISPIISLVTENDNEEYKKSKITLDLNIFLRNLLMGCLSVEEDSIIIDNDIEIKVGFPLLKSISLFGNIDLKNQTEYQIFSETYQEFIEYIKIKNTIIDFNLFETDQKIKILEKISLSLLKKVQDKILNLLKVVSDIDLFQVSSFKSYNFNFYTLSYMYILKLFFSYDIKSLYQEIFNMALSNLPPNYVLELTPIERKIHNTIITEHKRAQSGESHDFDKVQQNFDDYNKKTNDPLASLALEFGDIAP